MEKKSQKNKCVVSIGLKLCFILPTVVLRMCSFGKKICADSQDSKNSNCFEYRSYTSLRYQALSVKLFTSTPSATPILPSSFSSFSMISHRSSCNIIHMLFVFSATSRAPSPRCFCRMYSASLYALNSKYVFAEYHPTCADLVQGSGAFDVIYV